jgi:tRNA(Leu) C34 or U34 (ribose-2'-O)-methylase TrmL
MTTVEGTTIIKDGVGADLAVALCDPKYDFNVAQAIRIASCYGVPQVWFSGSRVNLESSKKNRLPREERMKGYRDVQICHGDRFFDAFSSDVTPVGVELTPSSENLLWFEHPEKAVYVFGPEDGGLGKVERSLCHRIIQIPTKHCLNLSMAVGTILYDRHYKRVLAGLEAPHGVAEAEGRGFVSDPTELADEMALLSAAGR